MTKKSNKNPVWIDLVALADNDRGAVGDAARALVNTRGHVPLRALEQKILKTGNPALLATINAAEAFAQVTNCTGKLIDLPHIEKIYALACKDTTLPHKILKNAAALMKTEDDIDLSIQKSIERLNPGPEYH